MNYKDATVELIGSNSITINANANNHSHINAINAWLALIITGNGTLSINIHVTDTATYDTIFVLYGYTDLILDGCNISVTLDGDVGTTVENRYFLAYENMIIKNHAKISLTDHITGESVKTTYCVWTKGSLSITDSELVISATRKNVCGIYCKDNMTISNSTVRSEGTAGAFVTNGKINIDDLIWGGNTLGEMPSNGISANDVVNYHVVWIEPKNDVSQLGIVLFLVCGVSAIVIACSFLRKD